MASKKIIIAVDGHSSCGKSTIAKRIAKELNYIFIDTGAMYRAVTLYCINNNLIHDTVIDEAALNNDLDSIFIEFVHNQENGANEVHLNNVNVESEIRKPYIANKVSYISALGTVRTKLVEIQREMGSEGGIVMDGRDIGTVVFPDADLKLFVTAKEDVRAQRRYDELMNKGVKATFEEVKENLLSRDHIDSNRKISPLRQADDAVVLDNSNLTREEQHEWVMGKIAVLL